METLNLSEHFKPKHPAKGVSWNRSPSSDDGRPERKTKMKIIIGKKWHESWADLNGQPYDATIDNDNDQIIKLLDGNFYYSHVYLGECGTTLEYLPVPANAEIKFLPCCDLKIKAACKK